MDFGVPLIKILISSPIFSLKNNKDGFICFATQTDEFPQFDSSNQLLTIRAVLNYIRYNVWQKFVI